MTTFKEELDQMVIKVLFDGTIPLDTEQQRELAYRIPKFEQAIIELVEREIIGEDDLNYRPYLVVRHKLGLEANQTQAKLIAVAVNKLRAEQRQKLGVKNN